MNHPAETRIAHLSQKVERQKNILAVNTLLAAASVCYAGQEELTALDAPMSKPALGITAVSCAAGAWIEWRKHRNLEKLAGLERVVDQEMGGSRAERTAIIEERYWEQIGIAMGIGQSLTKELVSLDPK
jgi:hypothetical protein